jgi:hypothetical protein
MQQSYENRELRRENQKLKEQLRDVTLLSDTDTLIAPVPRSQALYLGIPTSPAAYVGSLGGSEIQPSEIYIPSDENFHSRLAPSEPVSPSGASPRQEILPSIHNISLASLAGARDDFTKQRPDWPLLLHDPTNWSGRRTTLRSIFSNTTLKATMLPRLEGQPPRSGQGCSQEHLYEQVLERVATEPTSIEAHHDYTTTADSGYHSGTRNSCTNLGEGGSNDSDTDSVVTDGWPSSLPRQDKYMLEAEFAREIFNRSSARTREQLVKRGQTVKDLLYSFSVMMWGRATSVAERGAASFVRHGRKYVP